MKCEFSLASYLGMCSKTRNIDHSKLIPPSPAELPFQRRSSSMLPSPTIRLEILLKLRPLQTIVPILTILNLVRSPLLIRGLRALVRR